MRALEMKGLVTTSYSLLLPDIDIQINKIICYSTEAIIPKRRFKIGPYMHCTTVSDIDIYWGYSSFWINLYNVHVIISTLEYYMKDDELAF